MGQIVGKVSDIFRCNLRAIQTGGTKANTVLAADEVWLVDTTNSLTNSLSGNCDAYIIGDGSTVASALVLRSMSDDEPTLLGKNSISTGGVKNVIDSIVGRSQSYENGKYINSSGSTSNNSSYRITSYIPYTVGTELTWIVGSGTEKGDSNTRLVFCNSMGNPISGALFTGNNYTTRAISTTNSSAKYVRFSYKTSREALTLLKAGNTVLWTAQTAIVPQADRTRPYNNIVVVEGKDFQVSYAEYYGIQAGHTYKLTLLNPAVPISNITYDNTKTKLTAVVSENGTEENGVALFNTYFGTPLPKSYNITIPSTFTDPYLSFRGRFNIGSALRLLIEDVTKEDDDTRTISQKLAEGEDVHIDITEFSKYGTAITGQFYTPTSVGKSLENVTMAASTNYKNIRIPIEGADYCSALIAVSSGAYGDLILDENDVVLFAVRRRSSDGSSYLTHFPIPSNARYLIHTYYSTNTIGEINLYSASKKTLNDVEEEINGAHVVYQGSSNMPIFLDNNGTSPSNDGLVSVNSANFLAAITGLHSTYYKYRWYFFKCAGFTKVTVNQYRTSNSYGSVFLDRAGNTVGSITIPPSASSYVKTVDIPANAYYFLYNQYYTLEHYVEFTKDGGLASKIEALQEAVSSNTSNSSTDYILTENNVIDSAGNLIASTTSVMTSPIWGGRGFYLLLHDGYKVSQVHLFNAGGSLAAYDYIASDVGRGPLRSITTNYSRQYASLSFLPQFFVRVVIVNDSGTTISSSEKIIKSFCYLDNKFFKRIIDENGYLARAQRRMAQINNVVWTPLVDVPCFNDAVSAKFFKKGRIRQGIPYSDVAEYDKYVGIHVSVKTFLTAAKNKRSLLYTEKCAGNVHSEYGITYNNSLAWCYFGAVCSSFTAVIADLPALYLSGVYHNNGITGLSTVANPSFDNVQPLDFIWNDGHISIISDIITDEFGERKFVVWAEQKVPTNFITPYTRDMFEARIHDESIPCEIHRFSRWSSVQEPPVLDFIQNNMWDYPCNVDCDSDIQTFAGDYACFAEGDVMFLNLNRTKGYTTLEIYKNDSDTALHTIDISNTTIYPSDGLYPEDNEDWVKFNLASLNLTYGKYKARLTDGSNSSGYTYWEVIDITLSASVSDSSTTVVFGSTYGTPYLIQLEQPSGFPSRYAVLGSADVEAGTKTCDWIPSSTLPYVKVFVRGDYGVAVKRVNTQS